MDVVNKIDSLLNEAPKYQVYNMKNRKVVQVEDYILDVAEKLHECEDWKYDEFFDKLIFEFGESIAAMFDIGLVPDIEQWVNGKKEISITDKYYIIANFTKIKQYVNKLLKELDI